ncbi:MAG: 1-acyl-sn-glycerol-3-phosphate acyltransferase [bacterium]
MKKSYKWRLPITEEERGDIIDEVVERVMQEKIEKVESSPDSALEYIINDILYHERRRAASQGNSEEMLAELDFLFTTTKNLKRASEKEKQEMLERIARHYAEDIAGHFNHRVYRFASQALPVLLTGLFNSFSPDLLLRNFPKFPDLLSRVVLRGDIDNIRELATRGTLIFTPTHSSNLDSIVVGWSLIHTDLPPVNYGAGKNLFTNPALSFFMNRLGAYKVDRRLKHDFYKDILKMYSEVILNHGCHCLFFPGGTRSRSGGVESKLKLGLLGTGLTAYINNLLNGREPAEVYVVPMTINYPIVLEGETLIEDYLAESGKARYIIEDDDSSKPFRMLRFLVRLMRMESSMAIMFAPPLDIFGNRVDYEGHSLDRHGRPIDIRKYVANSDGEICHDPARDTEYVNELGTAIAESFRHNVVVFPTHVLSFVLFEMLTAANPGVDLYRLLSYEGEGARFAVSDVVAQLETISARLVEHEHADRIKLIGPIRSSGCGRELLQEALNYFGMSHAKPAAIRKGEKIAVISPKLVYYYRNRLDSLALEGIFGEQQSGPEHTAN